MKYTSRASLRATAMLARCLPMREHRRPEFDTEDFHLQVSATCQAHEQKGPPEGGLFVHQQPRLDRPIRGARRA